MAKDQAPDYSTPKKKKRFVEEVYQSVRREIEESHPEAEPYYDGIFGVRRKKAILNTLDRAEEAFQSLGMTSFLKIFVNKELLIFNNYNRLDENADLRIGMALWVLDKLRSSGQLIKACDLLPDVSDDADAWYLPLDFAHPCYANDLIQSVVHVITNRYRKQAGVVITEENAGGKKPSEAYQGLLALLPEDEVQKACEAFREKSWELEIRFMKGLDYFDKELGRIFEDVNNIPPVSRLLMDNPKKEASASVDPPLDLMCLYSLSSPYSLGSLGGLGRVGGLSGLGGADSLPGRLDSRNTALYNIARRGRRLVEVSCDFITEFDRYLWMDRRAVRRESGSREIAEATADFTVTDPYALCFALFYLLDTGDDAPWLMRAGTSLMMYALRMLPWFVEEEALDEEAWNARYDGLQYNRNGWLTQERAEEPIDFYHERHKDRNLAQVVYDLCRTVVPTGLHPFEQDRKRLIDEGMEEGKARKLTDMADLLFLYTFQARQRTASDLTMPWNDDEEEAPKAEGTPRGLAEPAALPKDSGDVEEETGETPAENTPDMVAAREEEAKKLKADLSEAKKRIKALQNALAIARQEESNERAKYEHELKSLRMEHRELADLRELVFNQKNEDQKRLEKPEKTYDYPYKTKKRTVVFGGHDSFLRAIKPMLPTVKFVDAQNLTYSPKIIRNADVVWIQNNCISHSQFGSIAKNCKLSGVQMRYFGYASAEKCAEQLVDWDQNGD